MGLEPPSLAPWIRPCGESQKGTGVEVAAVDPGFSEGGGGGGLTVMHGRMAVARGRLS